MSIVINIRGTSGAGKTTLARTYVSSPHVELCSREIDGKRYVCHGHVDEERSAALIGRYGKALSGGCDRVDKGELIRSGVLRAIEIGAELVILEGLLVSTIFSTYASFDHHLRREGHVFVWAFLQPEPDECVSRALSRFGESYDDAKRAKVRQKILQRHEEIRKVRDKVRAADLRCLDLDTTRDADGAPRARAQLDAYVAELREKS